MKRAVYKCSNYNGYKDVLFFMKPADAKYRNGLKIEGLTYTLVTKAESINNSVVLGCNGSKYKVFEDYSIRLVGKLCQGQ